MAKTASLVKWSKPAPRIIGKNKVVMDDEYIYTSKCGRFVIDKRMMYGGRNGYSTTPMYKLSVDGVTSKYEYDSLAHAKNDANYTIDPDWEGGL